MGLLNSNNTHVFNTFDAAARVAAQIGGKVVNMGNRQYGVFTK